MLADAPLFALLELRWTWSRSSTKLEMRACFKEHMVAINSQVLLKWWQTGLVTWC